MLTQLREQVRRAAVPVAIPANARRFEIDPGRTPGTVIVRRAGPLARLGHDHVVTSAAESGMAWRGGARRRPVLDAVRHPVIRIHALSTSGAWPNPLVRIGIVVRGVEHAMEVPVVIEQSAEEFIARGTFEVRQSEFGMTPFAVAGGAIQVADVLEIRFEIAATGRD